MDFQDALVYRHKVKLIVLMIEVSKMPSILFINDELFTAH